VVRFSIVIPTWKNIEYLDVAYRGLRRNSAAHHEIIVFFNEFDSACSDWVGDKDVLYDQSDTNLGVCGAVNRAAERATTQYLCFMNDDMYALPGWDTAFAAHLDLASPLWLSGTAIEPGVSTPCYIGNRDYGHTPETFDEEKLLREHASLKRPYNVVSTWSPTLWPLRDWQAAGGFDEKYFPGNGSDPDLAMAFYKRGCRHFIGVGTSLVYHFSRITTSRFDERRDLVNPKAYFKQKWGMSWRHFFKHVLYRDKVITDDLLRKIRMR